MQGARLHLRGRRQSERDQLGYPGHAAARRSRACRAPSSTRSASTVPIRRSTPTSASSAPKASRSSPGTCCRAEGTVPGPQGRDRRGHRQCRHQRRHRDRRQARRQGHRRPDPGRLERHRERHGGCLPQDDRGEVSGHQSARHPDGRLRALGRRGQGRRHPAGQSRRERRLRHHRQQHPDLVGRRPQGRPRRRHHRHGLHPPEPRSGEVRRRLRHRRPAALRRERQGCRTRSANSPRARPCPTSIRCRPRSSPPADLDPYYKMLDSAGQ